MMKALIGRKKLSMKVEKSEERYLYEKSKIKRKKESKIQTLSKKLTTCQSVERKMSTMPVSEKVPKAYIEKQIFLSKDSTPKERTGDRSMPPICKNEKRLKKLR